MSDMDIRVAGTLASANGKTPVARAKDIEMPDGSRLSEFNPVCPIVEAVSGAMLEPETLYKFGSVTELSVTLAEKNDGKAHEYCLKFIPAEGFTKPVIVPEPVWYGSPQFPVGKICEVVICDGTAVSVCG